MTNAIIVAAGSSERFGGGQPKQFKLLAGKPVLLWSVERFATSASIDSIVIVATADHLELVRSLTGGIGKVADVIAGGATRQESVRLGLAALSDDSAVVLVHDAARPCLSSLLLDEVLVALKSHEAVVPALPVGDTLVLSRDDAVDALLDRAGVQRVQTPQGFRTELLRRAHHRAEARGYQSSDDGSLVFALDEPVHIVPGDPQNLKITYESDLSTAEAILAQSVGRR